ncbi:penicillin-binding protein 1C [Microbaculum marinisediminis]|uniref:peptidoglycan glycosyltransferase n=1 Tax=Microbaculum marinisediminis TaxID=2931392 RepID=A0AAW5R058_9HYPH|nr:penicillin-binding protein 1C [Microbaculum sp. A6E488]MCT8972076.1 penicillin-binding protein 1C [Microbaculum sp. A6E488]
MKDRQNQEISAPQRTRRRDIVRSVAGAVFAVALVGAIVGVGGFLTSRDGAAVIERARAIDVSRELTDRDGTLLNPFAIEDGRWRLKADLASVDPRFVQMLVAYEDKRFRDHAGVDPLALGRAAWQLATNGRIVSGGSTLTMQVARLLSPRGERSLGAKLRQMRDAIRLDLAFSKDELLRLYLTLAPYGGNLEGVRAASLAYFGHEPRKFSLAEAALLVALPQSPEARRPDRDPQAARAARDRVLDRLVTAGAIQADELQPALVVRIPAARQDMPNLAPHLARLVSTQTPDAPGWQVSLDARLQADLEALAQDSATALGPVQSVAILVADHGTGEVLAEVGSADFFDERRAGQVDMVRAIRSPGSTLKPLIYGLAFEAGLAHPETLIDDRPTNFGGYRPRNFDFGYQGTVSVREALEMSLNVPAVRLLEAVGPTRLVARLKRAGADPVLPRGDKPGLPIGLGGVGLSLDQLVTLFAGLAEGGAPVSLHRTLESPARASGEFLDARAAWQVGDILEGTPPPAGHASGGFAYKTGTSYGYRDAWSVGYDGRHVIGVWVGRPNGAPIAGLSGRITAAPILFDAFERLGPKRVPLPSPPKGTLISRAADLPPALRRFAPGETLTGGATREPPPSIVFPPNGARVALEEDGEGHLRPLVVKLDGGRPPFQWFANGAPIDGADRRRNATWQPDGRGFSTVSVIDADGRSASVTVFVE